MPLGSRPKRISGSGLRSEVVCGQPGAPAFAVWAMATVEVRPGPTSNARDTAEARAIRKDFMGENRLSGGFSIVPAPSPRLGALARRDQRPNRSVRQHYMGAAGGDSLCNAAHRPVLERATAGSAKGKTELLILQPQREPLFKGPWPVWTIAGVILASYAAQSLLLTTDAQLLALTLVP